MKQNSQIIGLGILIFMFSDKTGEGKIFWTEQYIIKLLLNSFSSYS